MMDTKAIEKVIDALLGGCAEPIGDTQIDNEKIKIQTQEEELIDWLVDDIYRCLQKEKVYWASGRVAGSKARRYLFNLYEMIGEMLEEKENETY